MRPVLLDRKLVRNILVLLLRPLLVLLYEIVYYWGKFPQKDIRDIKITFFCFDIR